MRLFLERLLRDNGPATATVLRNLAAQLEAAVPGAPRLAAVAFATSQEVQMGQITVKDSDADFRGTVTFLDAKGSPTEPDDTPQWTVDDGKGATLTPGSPGGAEAATAQVTVTSTDTDGTVITSVGAVTVTSGEAAVGDVEFQAAPAP